MAGTWQEIRAARYSIMTPPPEWPAGVRPISIDGVSLFGINPESNKLYWDGREIVVRDRVASENSIHLTRSHPRIRTRSSDDWDRPLVRPYAVRLLQAASAAGSRNPDTAASAQRAAAAHATPSTAFALDRPRPVHLALSSLPSHSGCHAHRQARDRRALASQGFYRLLAMEIPLAWWPPADRPRGDRRPVARVGV